MNLGPFEIILILVVLALIFGARKLPELGKGLGRGIKEFRSEVRDHDPAPPVTPPVTDVPSRQLDPVSGAPIAGQVSAGQVSQPEHGERRS